MQTSITLELDSEVLRRAEMVARKNGETLSRLVEDLLASMENPLVDIGDDGLTPLVRSLKGSLRDSGIDTADYRQHLVEKYL